VWPKSARNRQRARSLHYDPLLAPIQARSIPVIKPIESTLALALLLAVSGTGGPPIAAQTASPAPRLGNGRPDLTGVWMPPYVPDMTRSARDQHGYAEAPFSPADTPQARQAMYSKGNRAELPFTASGLQDWTTYDPADGDYTGSCLPYGLTRSFNAPYPYQILQSDTLIAVLFELNTWHHVIPFADHHPAQLEPTWFGHSIGRWDGDTLVVDTIGFNGYTRLDTIGHPHSAALHVTQTFTRTDAEHIAYTVRIEDPKTYTKPWTNERVLTLLKAPLLEYSCEENNKSLWDGRIKAWTPPWATGNK
jgi:hypothetical protein